MKMKRYSITHFFLDLMIGVMLVAAACSAPEEGGKHSAKPAGVMEAQVEVDYAAALDLTGRELLESKCTACHDVVLIETVVKSRLDWDVTLDQMEAFGAEIDDIERVELIEYLVGGQPGD